MLYLASCVEVVFVGERSCVLLVCITQILRGDSLCEKSCVDDIVEILLCEDGHVELGAQTSKHILVFSFDQLSLNSLSLSYIVHCIILFILYICLVLIVCHTCVEPRELYIAPQLLFRGI